jgi:hypothetical protein
MTYETHAASSELWRFDTRTGGWESINTKGVEPEGRDSHVMTSVGVDLWLHGGQASYDSSGARSRGDLWRFDTSTRGWEPVTFGYGPNRRYNHVMTSVGRDLWLHGGETGDSGEGDGCFSPVELLLLL